MKFNSTQIELHAISNRTLMRTNLDGNSLCVNVRHICLEPHSVNNQRILCKKTGNCSGHSIYPTCLLYLRLQLNMVRRHNEATSDHLD